MTIRYLKDKLIETLEHRHIGVSLKDITFVLTVPAIWNESAKVFMRLAAEKADIPNDQIVIALEPECASVWCQSLHSRRCENEDDVYVELSEPGTKYMVVDVGGGTADITVHQLQDDKSLKEIAKATGGPWGGIEVDNAFIQLLSDIVNKDVMTSFMHEETGDLLELCREFEIKKRTLTDDSTKGKVRIKMPASLNDKYLESGRSFGDIRVRYTGRVMWTRDKLMMDVDMLKKTFNKPICNLVEHVIDMLQEDEMADLKQIILVGGFAESPMLQQKFKEIFKHSKIQIMIPPECGLSVLKGAVLFGHNPSIVTTRVARYTYGVETSVPFVSGIHPVKNMEQSPYGLICRRAFWKAVSIGTPLPIGTKVQREGTPVHNNQEDICYGIYRSLNPNPVLVTDCGCEKIGEIFMKIDPEKTTKENTVEEVFHFGETEIRFSARHRLTGEEQQLFLHL